jgi:hypothetical protein
MNSRILDYSTATFGRISLGMNVIIGVYPEKNVYFLDSVVTSTGLKRIPLST